MRRIFLGLTSVLASTSLMFGVAAAQSTGCDVVNTGPNSNNTCTVSDNNSLKVTCKNDADVVFVNNQSANSGNVTIQKNTNGGYAYSGNAVNSNSTTGQLDVSCGTKPASAPAPAPAPTPAPTPTPAPAAQPAVATTGGQGQAAPKAQALPETGNNAAVSTIVAVASIIGLAAIASRLGFSAYRHFSMK